MGANLDSPNPNQTGDLESKNSVTQDEARITSPSSAYGS